MGVKQAEDPREVVREFARAVFMNVPTWATRWPGSYLGVLARACSVAQAAGWDCTLREVQEVVVEVFRELGLALYPHMKLHDPTGTVWGIWLEETKHKSKGQGKRNGERKGKGKGKQKGQ